MKKHWRKMKHGQIWQDEYSNKATLVSSMILIDAVASPPLYISIVDDDSFIITSLLRRKQVRSVNILRTIDAQLAPLHLSDAFTFHKSKLSILQLCQVKMCLSQHPDRKGEFEVWVGNRTVFIEHTLNGFLRP